MNTKEITGIISGNRKEHIIDTTNENNLPQGYGLAPIKTEGQPIREYDHYFITSEECKTKEEAETKFWLNYKKNEPYESGDIFWRCKPRLTSIEDFNCKRYFVLYARFSILHNI